MNFSFSTHAPKNKSREKASFDLEKMKMYIEDEESVITKQKILNAMHFRNGTNNNYPSKERFDDEKRHVYNLYNYCFPFYETYVKPTETNLSKTFPRVNMACYFNGPVAYKVGLSIIVGVTMLKSMGTNTEKAIANLQSGKWHSCISLTEIGHGSNLMKLQTKATYDVKTETFILHTPTIEAWKCWSGNLGKGATHAIVLAQLYTPDDQCHGIHWFFVPVRDPATLKPYPGVIVGDMGEKIGFHGLDNGFMAFINYHIPKKSLLNRISDVTADGQFVTKVENRVRRFALTVSNLNSSRGGIFATSCYGIQQLSIAIAIRYGFADSGSETAIANCRRQQLRLFPHLSSAYVFNKIINSFLKDLWNHQSKVFSHGIEDEKLYVEASDIHTLLAGLKSIIASGAAKCAQESLEYCSILGCLEVSGLKTLRNEQDANLTLEGDNNILLQQVSKTLLKVAQSEKAKCEQSNMRLYDFIDQMDATIKRKYATNTMEMNPESIESAFNWLLCHLLNECLTKMTSGMMNGASAFDAFNNLQVYDCNVLATVFIENFIITRYFNLLNRNKPSEDCESLLQNLGLMYSCCCLEKYMLTLCTEGYFNWDAIDIVQNRILNLCDILKEDALSLADVLAPPDEMLNPYFASDGERKQNAIF